MSMSDQDGRNRQETRPLHGPYKHSGRVSALVIDDLGNPIHEGEIAVDAVKPIDEMSILISICYPWMPLAERSKHNTLGGAAMTPTEARMLAEMLTQAAEACNGGRVQSEVEEYRAASSGKRFRINIEIDVVLDTEAIWPDGDSPESPTAADVERVYRAQRHSILRSAEDWDLDQEAVLTVSEVT